MRRVLAWAALLTLFAVCPVSAQMVSSGPTWATHLLTWRTQASGSVSGYVDSSVTRRAGVASVDTTAAFSLLDIVSVKGGTLIAAAGADSVVMFRFDFEPTGNASFTSTFDSVYVTPQVSDNGVDWISLCALNGLEDVGGEHVYWSMQSNKIGTGTCASFFGFAVMRFVIQMTADVNGEFQGHVAYYTNRQTRL